MPAVQPKAICGKCGLLLQGKEASCPSCGVEVDWQNSGLRTEPEVVKGKPEKKGSNKEKKSETTSSSQSGKLFLGAVALVAIGVVVYEVVLRNPQTQNPTQPAISQPMSVSQETEDIKNLEEQVRLNPGDLTSKLQLANMLFDNSMFPKAIMYYKQYLEEKPENSDVRVDLGICYKETGDLNEAKKCMLEALKNSPKHLYAHFNLGIIALTAENIPESNEWFKKTVALDPTSEVGKRAQQLLIQHNQPTPKKN